MIQSLLKKNLHRWLPGYARDTVRRLRAGRSGERLRHLLFAFCDHYEPLWKSSDHRLGAARVATWHEGYPKLAAHYRDADGHPPRHSFFFPAEEYAPEFLEPLADLAARGLGEVELHLHHDADTAGGLRQKIDAALSQFGGHGHLARDHTGRPRYAFIHGNWALANCRDDGRWCGVDDELAVLFDSGCYADFTFPSAPHPTQPPIVNQIYWPAGDLHQRRAHERGQTARVGELRSDRPLMIQGPLALTVGRGPRGLRPRIESAAVTAEDPGSPDRVASWTAQRIGVVGRPEWVFVKVHTHGCPERQAASLLGDGGHTLHRELTTRYNDGKRWALHYVTAREMFNIAVAAMEGHSGNPHPFRDHRLPPPPVLKARHG